MPLQIEPWLLHPVAVHFPIAMLVLGLAAGLFSKFKFSPSWAPEAVSWLLWLGTAAAWVALLFGLLAEDTAPHVPSAWHVMGDHKTAAFWSAGWFTFLSVWRVWLKRKREWAFLALWVVAVATLLRTGFLGGELVFTHGVGGAASVAAEAADSDSSDSQ